MPERSCVCVGVWGGPSFIGGWRTCVLGRRHCSRRQGAALRHPNRGVRRPSLGNLRCCASWAWLGGRSQTRALGPGLRAGGSTGVPTAPPSGGGKKMRVLKTNESFRRFTGWLILRGGATYPLFEGEVWRGAPRVLTGQEPVGVPRAGRVGVGGGVGAGGTHGRRHVAVVMQHWAVARVGGRGLRGGRVGPAQQRCGAPVHGLVRPEEETEELSMSRLPRDNKREALTEAYDAALTCCPAS